MLLNRNENFLAVASSLSTNFYLSLIISMVVFLLIVVTVIICACGGDKKKLYEVKGSAESDDQTQQAMKSTSINPQRLIEIQVDNSMSNPPVLISTSPQQTDSNNIPVQGAVKKLTPVKTDNSQTPVANHSKQVVVKQVPEGSKLARQMKRAIEAEAKKVILGKAKTAPSIPKGGDKATIGGKVTTDAKQSPNAPGGNLSWPSLTADHTYYNIDTNMPDYEADPNKVSKDLLMKKESAKKRG